MPAKPRSDGTNVVATSRGRPRSWARHEKPPVVDPERQGRREGMDVASAAGVVRAAAGARRSPARTAGVRARPAGGPAGVAVLSIGGPPSPSAATFTPRMQTRERVLYSRANTGRRPRARD